MVEGVANQLADYFGSNVNVMLYACSAASQDDSFAETLASTLASNGVTDVRVFGHTTAAHTTRNPQGRGFVAHREGENVTTTGRTNQEAIFDATFLDAEAQGIYEQLSSDPLPAHVTTEQMSSLTVDRVRSTMNDTSARWLTRNMPSIQVGERGVASYVIGSHSSEAIAAVRTFWQQPEQGKKTVFDTLFPVRRRRRRRR